MSSLDFAGGVRTTDKELIKLSRENLRKFKQGSLCELYDEVFIKGYKLGRPKWHKPSEKLPADCSLVFAYDFEDSEPALFKFVTSNTWEWMPRRIACLSNDQIKRWCEIPKFDEE